MDGVRDECTLKRKKSLLPVGQKPGISRSSVKHFNHLATKHPHDDTNNLENTKELLMPEQSKSEFESEAKSKVMSD